MNELKVFDNPTNIKIISSGKVIDDSIIVSSLDLRPQTFFVIIQTPKTKKQEPVKVSIFINIQIYTF